ncbi:hypothetical protein [Sphingomonas sp.]|jgi:hypothetical protein|uniref:hypothetical protein n=1 Tax=Sphingomonas sp. TaxID=28214 RepID=UPI002E3331F7|nr:hypothetical protein [Sphingomonas sp.]HEX4694695.1 hypothetical protein [Sphingomonas sp.]
MSPIKLPAIRAIEPTAISVFIQKGHPWMALAYGALWLITTSAGPIMFALAMAHRL